MSLKMRLSRGGSKKRPYYRVVVAESTSPRDGRFIERVGTYNPMLPKDHVDRVRLFHDRIRHWLGHGAKPTDRVARFLQAAEMGVERKIPEQTKKSQPKARAQERLKEREEKRLDAEEAAREVAVAGSSAEERAAVNASVED